MDLATSFGSLFALIGAGLLVFAARQFALRRAFLRRAVAANGTVVALERESDSEQQVTYFPRIEFRTPTGRPVCFRSRSGSGAWLGRIGERVIIRYLPNQPDRAEIDSFWPMWGAALVSTVLGLVFASIGIGGLTGFLPS